MLSWNDSKTSSEDPLFVGDDASSVNVDVPETLYDPDFYGIERHSEEQCDHWEKLAKYVAFEGENTGRRFLGCARAGGEVCSTVNWIDPEWPPALKKCLVRIWELYEEECGGRIREACEQAEAYYKLNLVKKELEEKIKELQIKLGKAISASQVSKQMQVQLDLYVQVREKAGKQIGYLLAENKKLELLKDHAEKQRDVLKEKKKKFEYYISELLDAGQVNKLKLKKMKEILDE